MANKKVKKQKSIKAPVDRETARRTRTIQIVVAVFSIMLILSMILSLTTK